jgi:NADPH2:quinone reductase
MEITLMKAIRVHEFGPPGVMKLEEVPNPVPDGHQILVAVKAAGINPVDTYVRSGTYARKKPALPYTPGFDAAGVVESAGSSVRRFKPGDRVFINGTVSGAYAELALCAEENVFALPEHISFAQGAGIWVPYATAYHALFHVAKARAAESVLVHGASGGVGTAAVQMSRAAGLVVLGSAGSEAGLQMVRQQKALALNHHDSRFVELVLAATEGRGPDIILEMLANMNLAKDLSMVAPRGRIVIIGNRGTIEINPRDAMGKDASIHGMMLLNTTPEETSRIAAALAAGLECKTLNPIVGRQFPLAEAPQAHEAVLAPGAFGKIVLIP